ncbi:unnamed protein product [Chrysoparadoxa australica]
MSGKHFITNPEGLLTPRSYAEGQGAIPPQTVYDVFKRTVKNHGDGPALHYKADGANGPWTTLSWQKYYDMSIQFAKALLSLGFSPHRCINILGYNSVEWFVANMGAIAAGGIAAGIYLTNNPDACKYISDHSQAEVVVVEGKKQLDKYLAMSSELKNLKALVVYGEAVPEGAKAAVPIHSWDDFMALGKDVSSSAVDERLSEQKPGNCCSLIYTSGTTGPPKAVMISHDNITWTSETLLAQYPLDHRERVISYLPLSHIAAQILDIHGPCKLGSEVFFAQPDALRGSLGATLKEVKPTLFFGVPRVWEKIYEKMQAIGRSTEGLKKKISTWAKRKGSERSNMGQYGGGGGVPCGYGIANAVVFSKVKQSLGLDQAKCCFTAAAPIPVQVLEYFASLDIAILEVFGQSECTGPHTANLPSAWKIGTCGRPLPGTESKIAADTGEILCYRGRHIFMGYMHDPAKTAETIDEEGWLHSGDVAAFDKDEIPGMPAPSGFMSITGRIKELIITAGGENIPPVIIEDQFKKQMPCLSNAMVIGDKRKFLTILLTLKVEVDADGKPTNKLTSDALSNSKAMGSSATTVEEAAADDKWKAYLDGGLKKANEATTSRAQVVQKWALLPVDFSEPGGELTPTLKLKRGPTAKKHSAVIEELYA